MMDIGLINTILFPQNTEVQLSEINNHFMERVLYRSSENTLSKGFKGIRWGQADHSCDSSSNDT